jgi:putative hydrolase of the HAD superfamily
LDRYIHGFVINGDVGVRKPEQAIFDYLIGQLTVSHRDAVFVDDQRRNLDAAAALGFSTILFVPAGHDLTDEKHFVATSFADILGWLCSR